MFGSPSASYPEVVNVDMEQNIDERNKKTEEEPYLHILDIACGGKVTRHPQEDGGEDKHGC